MDKQDIDIFAGAAQILESDEHDLIRLAELSGFAVSDFYVGANFDGVDIRGCDLRALNLKGAKLDSAIIDSGTKIDPKYVPPDWNLNTFKSAELAGVVYDHLTDKVQSGKFHSRTAALRHLVRLCHIVAPTFDDIISWQRYILSQTTYKKAFNTSRRTRKNMSIKVYDEEHHYVLLVGRAFHGRSAGYNGAAMIGMEVESGKVVPEHKQPKNSDLPLFRLR